MLVGILALPTLAYFYIPSFKTKISLTLWNIHIYKGGEIGQYSDTQRLASYAVGLELGQCSPLLGTGLGDLNDETARLYAERFPGAKPMMPHNQFLFFFAGAGLPVTILFGVLFFFTLFYKKRYNQHF